MSVRTPPHRSSHRRGGPGFTLIEILVVLVIVGVLLAVAMLSFGILSDNDSLEREARRLSSLIELVSDEATTQGRDFGLEFMTAGYRFVEYDPLLDQWFEIIGDDYLVQRNLDEGTEFELFLEDHKVLLHTEAQETEREQDEDEDDLYNIATRDLTSSSEPLTTAKITADRSFAVLRPGHVFAWTDTTGEQSQVRTILVDATALLRH